MYDAAIICICAQTYTKILQNIGFQISLEEKLYIIMEYIEGAPLADHFHSLTEKRERFSEERIWRIFVQVQIIL